LLVKVASCALKTSSQMEHQTYECSVGSLEAHS